MPELINISEKKILFVFKALLLAILYRNRKTGELWTASIKWAFSCKSIFIANLIFSLFFFLTCVVCTFCCVDHSFNIHGMSVGTIRQFHIFLVVHSLVHISILSKIITLQCVWTIIIMNTIVWVFSFVRQLLPLLSMYVVWSRIV